MRRLYRPSKIEESISKDKRAIRVFCEDYGLSRKKKRINGKARELESNLPRSEVWFRFHWKKCGFHNEHDEFNTRWVNRIPDCVNHKFRYVIEIDGSIHETEIQKAIDKKKDRFYAKQKYAAFRIKHNDLHRLMDVGRQVTEIRKERNDRAAGNK